MKHIRSYLTLAVTLAILLSCLFVNLVGCDEAFVNSSVTLGPDYANHDKYWWIYNIDAGTTISIVRHFKAAPTSTSTSNAAPTAKESTKETI